MLESNSNAPERRSGSYNRAKLKPYKRLFVAVLVVKISRRSTDKGAVTVSLRVKSWYSLRGDEENQRGVVTVMYFYS